MRNGRKIFLFSLLLMFFLQSPGSEPADPAKTWYPYFCGYKNTITYSWETYNLSPQNWAILQAKNGLIYVANQAGVLEFDGVNWRTILIPNKNARCIAKDAEETIYIGGLNEIGRLKADHTGNLHYFSLLHLLKSNQKEFSYVYQVLCTKDGTFFRTPYKLFRYFKGKLSLWEAGKTGDTFKAAFLWKNTLYIQQAITGLKKFSRNTFQPVSGGQSLPGARICMAVPYDETRLLIGTRVGFYLYNSTGAVPFPMEADGILKAAKLYHGVPLPGGHFAAATLKRGMVIFDKNGRLQAIYNKSMGLGDDNVKFICCDAAGNLWLALNKGITRIDYSSPVTFFGESTGLEGMVMSVLRYEGNLFAGTTTGLYQLNSPVPGLPPRFTAIPGLTGNCWSLITSGESLLAAGDQAVYLVENNKTYRARPVISNIQPFVLASSKKVTGQVWVGAGGELRALQRIKHQWVTKSRIACKMEIRSIIESPSGLLWLGTLAKGILNVMPGETGESPVFTHFTANDGLPRGEIHVTGAAGHVIFATTNGIFRFDDKKKSFVPDNTLGKEFADGSNNVFRLVQDRGNHIWFHSKFRNYQVVPHTGGDFEMTELHFPHIHREHVNAIYPEDHMAWFATSKGLICYDTATAAKKNFRRRFRALIRKVAVKGQKTPLFYGYKKGKMPGTAAPRLEYKNRNLHFDVAAPFFEDETGTRYRFFLDGFDENWSQWTSRFYKDYNNLDFGSYNFRLQSKNIYGTVSDEDTFSFNISPPFYLTWWAITLYTAALLFMVYLLVRWRSAKLIREKKLLEKTIEERTRELNHANVQLQQKTIQLEEQSEGLKEMDKIKSRFFANISHEFRTPLSLIMGPLDKVRDDCSDSGIKKNIDLALRNAQRLLILINQLLDLSKFESGKMKLKARQCELIPFLKNILEPFEVFASQQHRHLVFACAAKNITLYFDPDRLEKIMANLLSNALKFTPPEGDVTVTLTAAESDVSLSVKDTGRGIPQTQLEHIFERFYQVETTSEQRKKGTGIGLALVKELVELHYGEITAHSSEGENSGTEIILRLPLGSTHLKPGELETTHEPEYNEQTEVTEDRDDISSPLEALVMAGNVETEPEATTDTLPEKEKHGSRAKNIILVIEDNADLRYYIRTSLEPDYTVEVAKDGKEGLEKAQGIVPDLIVSDIMMPEMDGYELCETLKKDIITSHIPVVLLTARASEESILHGLETGADDYITKPFNTKILCARIKNLIDLRSQLQLSINREMLLKPSQIKVSDIDHDFLKDLQAVIGKNISDPEFNVEELSKRLYMSRTSVYRKIQALSGETPTNFIRLCRLKKAAQLLNKQFGSVTEVAFEVGFTSRAYFTKCFKEKFHRLPSEYGTSS
ncbi:MAG: response regulator [bacterium]|nr:response regulator [bacterium]